MIPAKIAQSITRGAIKTTKEIEEGIKIMAKSGSNFYHPSGKILSNQVKELEEAGYKVTIHENTFEIRW